MSKYFMVLLMLIGVTITACADDASSPVDPPGDNSASDVVEDAGSPEPDVVDDTTSVSSDVDDVAEDPAQDAGPEGESDASAEVPVEVEEEQAAGDPTEDPQDHSAYYEFAEWSIPANGNGHDEEGNR